MEEKFNLSFRCFSQLSDEWREVRKKKPNPKWKKVLLYPFFLIVCIFIMIFLVLTFNAIRSRPSYRTSGKYKKVIKEGLLWDSVEYHEK